MACGLADASGEGGTKNHLAKGMHINVTCTFPASLVACAVDRMSPSLRFCHRLALHLKHTLIFLLSELQTIKTKHAAILWFCSCVWLLCRKAGQNQERQGGRQERQGGRQQQARSQERQRAVRQGRGEKALR